MYKAFTPSQSLLKAYGLSYNEVLVVDADTPITREEYEKMNV